MTTLPDLSGKTHAELLAMVQEFAAKMPQTDANGIRVFALGERNKEGAFYKGTLGVKTGRNYTILYASQWLAVLDKADAIRAAIEANRSKLSWKE